jgi:hypothetical protein
LPHGTVAVLHDAPQLRAHPVLLGEGFQRRRQLFDEARQNIGGGCGAFQPSALLRSAAWRETSLFVATGAPLSGSTEQKLPHGPRKTSAEQAKAQRTRGFEHVDITFDESTPPEDPDSGSR